MARQRRIVQPSQQIATPQHVASGAALQRAMSFHARGELLRAEAMYREILAHARENFDVLRLMGELQCQRGAYLSGVTFFRRALKLNPNAPTVNYNLGLALQHLNRPAEALSCYDRAVALKPDYLEALANRGLALHALNRVDEALASYDHLLALKPHDIGAINNRGMALQKLNRLDEALTCYERALALQPNHRDVLNNRGTTLHALSRYEEAIASFNRALSVSPDYVTALNNRGNSLHALNRLDEALADYDRALNLKPDYIDALNNRGTTLRALKRFEEALASVDRALATDRAYLPALNNRGNSLRDLNRPYEALACYDRALAIKPDYLEAISNRAGTLRVLNRISDAAAAFDRALALRPDYAPAHWNRSLCLLVAGDFERGWKDFEWRWQDELARFRRNFTEPLWTGDENISGKTILLHAEQGLGDTIQFCRYAPLLAARGASVLLEVQRPLVSLLGTLDGVSRLFGRGDALPMFDYHCPLLSLPLAFKTTLQTIPAATSYVTSDAQLVAHWRTKLGTKSRPRIGLVWSGSTIHANDANRSIPLADFVRVLTCEAEFIGLQKELRSADEAMLSARSDIRHFGDELVHFADTAALVELMDLVISVDTSVAHLAAAMGKPVWILLPFAPDWRWLLGRDDTPWYPSAKLFRQPTTGDWSTVLEGVRHELEKRVRNWLACMTPAG